MLLDFLSEMGETPHRFLSWATGYEQMGLSSVPKQLLFQIVTAPGTEYAESHNLKGICCAPVRGVNNQ